MRSHNGYTLVEIVIAVSILGILAVAALPDSSPTEEYRLDVVANEIAQAIRFTQNEAIRSSLTHGIEVSQNTQKVTVYKAKMTGTSIGKEYILTHPLDKKPYQFTIDDIPGSTGVTIANTTNPFSYAGYSSLKNLVFDSAGTPKWTKLNDGSTYQLGTAKVILDYAGKLRTVNVETLTGRVTVQ